MELHAHPMELLHLIGSMHRVLAPIKLLDSPKLATHHAVLVYFVCGACGKENRCTYEIIDVGKESRWGYYGGSYGIKAETKLNDAYEEVEDVFRGMWTKWALVHANCQHWARDFYNRVGEESAETFHTYRQRIGLEMVLQMTGK
uniref:PPPDE domain-containing protein n=1 Tax=Globodera pallida TaxID=36090 RepID=A0A183CLV2_GLOPA